MMQQARLNMRRRQTFSTETRRTCRRREKIWGSGYGIIRDGFETQRAKLAVLKGEAGGDLVAGLGCVSFGGVQVVWG